ncbi:phosphoribosyltransferase family protein [Loigolactobacillus coryniformis subsp. coryniformis]|jgi:adenine phosphoribosyltransferase|uniref:Adenine phosphoribosyltransferase n=1 Tax=Loigolactobacillus coryniformis subsp. torquens DSM 20004 = KCTC 3535 TaxID=1423822 RepID=A0A2D1KKT9_9LACO|nr:phosphoribosyltransferase family protein [Loigolactobacillus coryniformis]ATO42760.1 adenine phosphoribosyltransferase [Loigolactobacillus coryniformis subsp. torquens DSM 20004 = KCTC 3535]KRK84262.1 adenine phosphoribosyltransferase [Loigolactobacillus coryniformis subsp. torquens DSM 20004 = KCTC 3535]MDT3391322.1 PRK07322 family protein [Bacillota bacterium]
MQKTYLLKIDQLERHLPIIPINATTAIASFVLLGDAELTHYAAEKLLKKLPTDFDYIVTLESKGIPLAQELSYLSHHSHYIVLRKSHKDYMYAPLSTTVHAITTQHPQQLFLDGHDGKLLAGKRIVIVDDVISSGGSLAAAKNLLEQANGKIIGQLAILAEGVASQRTDISYLAELPIFKQSTQIVEK